MTSNMSPYERLLARQRRQSKAYRVNKRERRIPHARDVGAFMFEAYCRKAAAAGLTSHAKLVDELVERGFDRDGSDEMLAAATRRAAGKVLP